MAKLGKRTRAAREAFAGKEGLSVEEAVKLVKGKVGRIPVNTCLPAGCQAGAELDADFTGRMKQGNVLKITFGNPEGQPVLAEVDPARGGERAGLRLARSHVRVEPARPATSHRHLGSNS